MLKLYLFGPPRIELDGSQLHMPRRKALALLVYLAATGRPHSREALATLFYPEQDQSRAKTYFRRDLGVANSGLAGGWIEADNEKVSLGKMDEIWIDTAEFRHLIANDGSSSPIGDHSHLEEAIELYVDDFLVGFSLPDCPEFDEWQFFEAENLKQMLVRALKQLINAHLERAAYDQAIPFARRQVNLDPLNEPAQRQLMKLYALAGQWSAALRQYELCINELEDSLGVAPEEATVTLYEAIKARQVVPPPTQPAESSGLILENFDVVPDFLKNSVQTDTPFVSFVGREREVHALQAAFDKARTGKGQIRLVTGEAGQGKSMLLEAFARRLYEKDAGLRFARGYCNAITGFSDPFLPFREILVMLTGDESAWAKQIKALTGQFGAEINQVQIFAQYAAALKAIAENRPLLLVVEDLHWIDVASSSLLFHLSRELTNSRILLVGTYRPEEVLSGHPMSGILSEMKRTYGDIWFDLGQQTILDKSRFIDAYLDTEPNHLGEKFRIALLERTSGHPLFTAELLRSMQDRGEIRQDENGAWVEGTAIKWKTLPAKVEGVIEKRIERLDEELQSILTTASVEGAVFTAEVVARIQRIEERPLVLQLSRELDKRHQLVEAQEVKWLDAGQQRLSTYRFRHNLFQNYLYHHLDEVERGYLHEAVGKTLENIYQITDEIAGQLAYHFQQAGLNAKAISYAEQACDSAVNVHAYDEAVVHIKRAVDLAEKTGAGAETLAHLSIRLGGLLLIIKGDGAPEVGLAYQQAYDLAKDSGQIRMQFEALRGLALFQRHRMEMEIAHKLTIEMCDLSQQLQDSALIIEASFALGSQSFFSGDHEEAEINLARSIATYNPKEHQSLANRHGQDPGVASLAYAAINAWMLGYPDRARDHYTRAIKLASEIDHAYSLTIARNWAAWTSVFLREPDNVLEHAQAAIRLAEKHNFPLFQAIGTCHCGWALAQRGEKEEAIRMMEQGLADAVVAWGSALGAPPFLALLAEMYGRFGQPNEGLETLKNAFVLIDQIEGHSWAEPELYRLRGLLSQSAEKPESEIEADLQQAINIARSQSARSLELRSTGDLARFWQRQRKPEQGREILSACYSWFTEGFDTVDLQEAQSFLNTLS